jgi:altronate dehydratase small subunit
MARAFVLSASDNVATLVDPVRAGDEVSFVGEAAATVNANAEIAYGHKLATREIAKGEAVLKYGKVIGRATQEIGVGDHVHVHNVEALRGRGDKKEAP